MLLAFKLKNSYLYRLKLNSGEKLTDAIWIDLMELDEKERQKVQTELKQLLVTPSELTDIEASARFFEDEYGLHIHSFFYYQDKNEHVDNSTVAFTFCDGRLYTLRERDLPAFNLYLMRSKSQKLINANAYELFLDLFEIKIEQLANTIENIYSVLETLSRIILEAKNGVSTDSALSNLAEQEDIGWKVRLCLMDSQRALNFLIRRAKLSTRQLDQARDILRDIESLLPHNESLFQKVNFLMQAAMGFINIEQNRIIKIFSVVSVIFLPPTLVASNYGMNFEFMPELEWRFGYPIAIILMIIAGLAPYFYFKRKNWL
ncbi:Magnesium transport protein CorA [Candidatus Arsenophonus lipoptenae]|uniref:Magnesium transport protein CorA n=1 Tax=Candidatus Arsenophonus lipoptenae TaxID=634113 RepID=A0A0X9W3Q1_9GAMM|nr:magnesium/cobalt transporter CorA [Candidatus Arsenophonus lipoptenae]AMA65149.1 Magnesium transport protein CorA [Candidatus Arsenophonus lipoptenae]